MTSNYNIPSCNRETRRRVEKFRRKYPALTFTQAYNILYHTNYPEPESAEATTEMPVDQNTTEQDTRVE